MKLIGGPFDGYCSKRKQLPPGWLAWPAILHLKMIDGCLHMENPDYARGEGHPYHRHTEDSYVSSDVDMSVIDEKEMAYA